MRLKAKCSYGDYIPLENNTPGAWKITGLYFTPDGCEVFRKKTRSKKVILSEKPCEFDVGFEWGDTFWTLDESGAIVKDTVQSVTSGYRGLRVNEMYPCEECFHTREMMIYGTFELIRQRRIEKNGNPEEQLLDCIFGRVE